MLGLFIGLGVGVLIGKAVMRRRHGAGFGGYRHRRRCGHHGHGHHHGFGHHDHFGHPPEPPRWGGGGGFWGPLSFLRNMPPPVRGAFEDAAFEVKRHLRDARGSFGDLANAFEQESFSVDEMGETIEQVRSAAEESASAFVGALAKVHGDLSRRERAEIAELLRRLR